MRRQSAVSATISGGSVAVPWFSAISDFRHRLRGGWSGNGVQRLDEQMVLREFVIRPCPATALALYQRGDVAIRMNLDLDIPAVVMPLKLNSTIINGDNLRNSNLARHQARDYINGFP